MNNATGSNRSFRRLNPTRFFLRGLAISLPPILTLVILLWIGRGINSYIVFPASTTVRWVIAKIIDGSIPTDSTSPRLVRLPNGPPLDFVGREYLVTEELKVAFDEMIIQRGQEAEDASKRQLRRRPPAGQSPEDAEAEAIAAEPTATLTGPQLLDVMQKEEAIRAEWLESRADPAVFDSDRGPEVYVPLDRAVPYFVYANVARRLSASELPATATGIYMDYAAQRYFGSQFLLSAAAVSLIVVLLYFLGRFVNARIGGWLVAKVENDLLGRLPVIRNVYGSAKQVTDFLFSEQQVEYRRVVAIEYPRRGIWSLGFVTGEAMLDVIAAVGEPCVNVLIPTSPMPVTGYTMSVPKSSLIDLNITVDQAFQFCISCGVLIPPNQRVTPEQLKRELTRRLTERMRDAGTDRRPLPYTEQVDSNGPAAQERVHPPAEQASSREAGGDAESDRS